MKKFFIPFAFVFVCQNLNAQKVGIGTTNPNNILSVNGSADITGNLGIGYPNPIAKLSVNGNSVMNGNNIIFGTLAIGTDVANNKLTVNGSANITGNLGIGIATPLSKLHLVQAADIEILLEKYGARKWSLFAGANNTGINATFQIIDRTLNICRLGIDNNGYVGIGTTMPVNRLSIGGNANITGNLGIGVDSPTAKLDVVGTIKTTRLQLPEGAANGYVLLSDSVGVAHWEKMASKTDSLGLGISTPVGELQVKSLVLDNNTLDQQFTDTHIGITTNSTNWQSFTAGASGLLVRLNLQVSSPLYNLPSPGTIKIFAGEGNSGTLLSTNAVTYSVTNNGAFQYFTLSNPLMIIAGNVYTIEFSAPSITDNLWAYGNTTNGYTGGRSSTCPNCDWGFQTFVASQKGDALVVRNGRVGVGTADPTVTLDVNGAIKTKYSGTAVFTVATGVTTPYNISIPPLPSGWELANTVLLVSAADGVPGTIKLAKLASINTIELIYDATQAGLVRFNWILFKM
jgi:hypothetical protein